jgi:hypothetical protein
MADRVGAKVGSSSEPTVVCLLRGTLVRTPEGERPVEELAIGDAVVTASGAAKPIRWIGRQRFRRAGGRAWVAGVLPVRIARGALDGAVPTRDLYVSQAHAILLDGTLVPAGNLLNGRTVVLDPATDLPSLDYFNVELDAHDAILADGAPVETFLSRDGNREAFDNFVEYERLYGREADAPAAYAPRVSARNRAERLRNAFAAAMSRN